MRTRKFVWVAKNEGWRPLDAPQFDASGPLVVAHDVLEHVSNVTRFEGELVGFGVAMYARDPDDEMAEISSTDFAAFYLRDKQKVKKPAERWLKPLIPSEERVIKKFSSLSSLAVLSMSLMNGLAPPDFDKTREATSNAAGWARLGWKLAKKLYRGHTREQAAEAFTELREAINEDHELNPPKDGDILTITFDFKTLTHKLVRERPAA